jgi:hypothetical protein
MTNSKNQTDKPSGIFNAEILTPAADPKDGRPYIIPGSEKPIDIESLPLKQQAILRGLARAVDKAEESGEIDGAKISITREQFDAEVNKLKKEKRKPKR